MHLKSTSWPRPVGDELAFPCPQSEEALWKHGKPLKAQSGTHTKITSSRANLIGWEQVHKGKSYSIVSIS
jgi:hypothetical protein